MLATHSAWVAASLALAACGSMACGAAPPPPPRPAAGPAPEPPAAPAAPPSVATTAELGGLDERQAEQSFRASLDGLEACIRDGVQRLEFIGGSIEFAVKVDASRHAMQV